MLQQLPLHDNTIDMAQSRLDQPVGDDQRQLAMVS